ncbi:MAG: hypothetical protein KA444_02950 [Bacteroidia bacterium]|nr:hypothetical protein [Bacteroidia bacterium]
MKKATILHLFFLSCYLFIFLSTGHAQSTAPTSLAMKSDEIVLQGKPAAAGTYQFIVVPSESGDPFTKDYLIMIENYRDETEERILPLTQYTKVRIPSRRSIREASFKPLKEIVYAPNHKPTSQTK